MNIKCLPRIRGVPTSFYKLNMMFSTNQGPPQADSSLHQIKAVAHIYIYIHTQSKCTISLYIYIHMCIPWKSKTKQRMVFRMIHVKDSLLPMGKVWSLDFLGIHISCNAATLRQVTARHDVDTWSRGESRSTRRSRPCVPCWFFRHVLETPKKNTSRGLRDWKINKNTQLCISSRFGSNHLCF